MTRKDYELIAEIIKPHINHDHGFCVGAIVENLCEVFSADNPHFDPDKFTRACGF